ncbi:sad1/unc-84-like protein-related [Anaeramoeba ignava]|uniref:Sad1/unc-84-like protein-related n=1 Tax=Anaeramoeba ignava TaxID=1746090 RepID=A0A9Q0LTC5_ANAIG|nr:sad1/unc-84-like protein-related [Anaeramoeba ignava]
MKQIKNFYYYTTREIIGFWRLIKLGIYIVIEFFISLETYLTNRIFSFLKSALNFRGDNFSWRNSIILLFSLLALGSILGSDQIQQQYRLSKEKEFKRFLVNSANEEIRYNLLKNVSIFTPAKNIDKYVSGIAEIIKTDIDNLIEGYKVEFTNKTLEEKQKLTAEFKSKIKDLLEKEEVKKQIQFCIEESGFVPSTRIVREMMKNVADLKKEIKMKTKTIQKLMKQNSEAISTYGTRIEEGDQQLEKIKNSSNEMYKQNINLINQKTELVRDYFNDFSEQFKNYNSDLKKAEQGIEDIWRITNKSYSLLKLFDCLFERTEEHDFSNEIEALKEHVAKKFIEIEREMKKTNDSMNEMEKKQDKEGSDIQNFIEKIQENIKQINESQPDENKLESLEKMVEKFHQDFQTNLKRNEEELETIIEQTGTVQKELPELENSLKKLFATHTKKEDIQNEMNKFSDLFHEFDDKNKNITDTLENVKKTFSNMDNYVDEFNKKFEEMKKELADTSSEMNNVENEKNEKNKEFQNKFETLKKQIEKLQNEEKEIQTIMGSLDNFEKEIEDISKKVDNLKIIPGSDSKQFLEELKNMREKFDVLQDKTNEKYALLEDDLKKKFEEKWDDFTKNEAELMEKLKADLFEHLENKKKQDVPDELENEIIENKIGEVFERIKEDLYKDSMKRFFEDDQNGALKEFESYYEDLLKDISARVLKNVSDLIQQDFVGKIDYALGSSGAEVISHSPVYSSSFGSRFNPLSYFHQFLSVLKNPKLNHPELALNPNNAIGNCFGFWGDKGFLAVRLFRKIIPTQITIEHVPKAVSPDFSSAPKDFSIFAYSNSFDSDPIFLGNFTFVFDDSYLPQTFNIPDNLQVPIEVVKFDFNSNYGKEFTCVYRVRVHGNPI